MIRLTRPVLGEAETRAVEGVLATGMLVQGERVAAFEARVAAQTGRRHAIAVSSGTGALELALRALGVGSGDEVGVPALTWPSPAHAVALVGATPVLADVDLREWNVTPATLHAAWTPRMRAAIVIDQFGNPARIVELARAAGELPLIVDAACSLGSVLDARPCGSYGVIACLSFHPRKVITTGEGGMCLTDDDAIAARLRVLRNHGQRGTGEFVEAAGNVRMSEIAAAIGVAQMERLDGIVTRRRTLAARYVEALAGFEMQQEPPGGLANRQTLGVLLPAGAGATVERRDAVVSALRAGGVEAGLLSYALHRLPSLAGARHGRLEVTEDVVDRGLALPLHPGMSEEDVTRCADAFREAVS
jgi:perosamine synthetase